MQVDRESALPYHIPDVHDGIHVEGVTSPGLTKVELIATIFYAFTPSTLAEAIARAKYIVENSNKKETK